MTLLASTTYDPAVAVSTSAATAAAMVAMDTTNLRLTFTAPANGSVLVRIAAMTSGATGPARMLWGILDGATVRMRLVPMGSFFNTSAATAFNAQEVMGVISGLTPGNSYTWDAAFGTEGTVASHAVKYGGPNDASGADAWGGVSFEIYDTLKLLGSVLYDPSTAATLSGTSLLAMTAMDTTNARITFTGPASGKVFWRIRAPQGNTGTTWGSFLVGILDGATVKARVPALTGLTKDSSAVAAPILEGSGIISVTPSTSYTWDAAYAVQVVAGGGGIKYGGPNNTTVNDAWGALVYEIWSA